MRGSLACGQAVRPRRLIRRVCWAVSSPKSLVGAFGGAASAAGRGAERDEPHQGGPLHQQPLHHAERLAHQPPAPQGEPGGEHAVRGPRGVQLRDGQLRVGGVVEDLEHHRARPCVEALGGEAAEVVGHAVPDVGLEQPLPPRAGLRAGVEVVEHVVVLAHGRDGVAADLGDAGQDPVATLDGGRREPAELEALLDGGGQRGVGGEAREGHVLELRDEAEELDGVRVLQASRPSGMALGTVRACVVVIRGS